MRSSGPVLDVLSVALHMALMIPKRRQFLLMEGGVEVVEAEVGFALPASSDFNKDIRNIIKCDRMCIFFLKKTGPRSVYYFFVAHFRLFEEKPCPRSVYYFFVVHFLTF